MISGMEKAMTAKKPLKRKAKYWVLKRRESYIAGYVLTGIFRDNYTGKITEQMGWGGSFAFKQSKAHKFYDIELLRKVVKAVNINYDSAYGKLRIVKVFAK